MGMCMILRSWNDFISPTGKNPPASITVGVFDGVHMGHQALMQRINSQEGLTPTVISFKQNPKGVVKQDVFDGDILSLNQKIRWIKDLGIHTLVLIDFSTDFSKITGKEFVGLLKDRGNLRYLVVGSDFRCGYELDTDAQHMQAMTISQGIPTDVVQPVLYGGYPVSSSRIRAAIAAGDLVEAAALLGRNVELDLTGMPNTPGSTGSLFDVSAAGRITPPKGRYPVLLYGPDSEGFHDFIEIIDDGMLLIPSGKKAQQVEFLL